MSDPLLITVAPTGAETAKEDCPHLPTTAPPTVTVPESTRCTTAFTNPL